MEKVKNKKRKDKKIYIYKFIVVGIFLTCILCILNKSSNYIRNEITDKINLVINNNNVTKSLKNDIIIENDVVYMSTKDIANFYDNHIYYDNKYNQIITSSEVTLATLELDEKECYINGAKMKISSPAKKINDKFYLPFSEISKSIYNVETKKLDNNIVIATSLDRELIYANSRKDNKIKYMPTMFSKTVDKVKKGDNLIIVSKDIKWTKVATENGKIGYIKTNNLANENKIRENLEIGKQIKGNVSLVWDYFSRYGKAPNRTERIKGLNVVSPTFFALKEGGEGEILKNVGKAGIDYINWAHENDYKVWALLSNDSMKNTTSKILNDYKLREKLIENILDLFVKYELDGINLDFEYMNEEDKDMYSRLIIELAPRLKELGKVLSVDVTAPDGSPEWSLCYDRNVIGEIADYIVFMGYDQNGISSPKEGTTAGCDWVEANIKKFLGQEGVKSEKIILGMPFYTRVWIKDGDKLDTRVLDMKETIEILPENTELNWNENLKQYYAEFEKNNKTYKVWIEDENSLKEKLKLVNKYKLAGAAYWEKDRENDKVWDIISEELNIK